MTSARSSILPLELSNLVYEVRGRRLVDGVSARLEAGPRTVILGANGAGKSLTLRLAHGLLEATSGSVRWCGPGRAEARTRQAMVFERAVLLRRSAAANVDYALAALAAAGGTAPDALAHLQDAVSHGWRGFLFANQDPAMASLHASKEYQALMQQVQQM